MEFSKYSRLQLKATQLSKKVCTYMYISLLWIEPIERIKTHNVRKLKYSLILIVNSLHLKLQGDLLFIAKSTVLIIYYLRVSQNQTMNKHLSTIWISKVGPITIGQCTSSDCPTKSCWLVFSMRLMWHHEDAYRNFAHLSAMWPTSLLNQVIVF